jgi:tetratricopeptide (TPR) repeat protein
LSRRRRWLLVLLAAAALAVGLGWYLWRRASAPVPPEVALEGVDPAVAKAVEAARRRVLQEPRSADTWGHLGMVLRAHDFAAEANTCFLEAERFAPKDPRWPYLHALTLLMTDPDAGLPRLRRAVELCRDDPYEPRLRLAQVLLARGEHEEAEQHFRQLLEYEADHPGAHLGLGRLAYQRGRLRACIQHLQVAAPSPWTRKSAHTLLAQVYRRLNDLDALRKLGPVDALPDDLPWRDKFVDEVARLRVGMEASLDRATRLLQQGRVDEAVALLRETAEQYPESGRGWLVLGQACIEVKDYAGAENALGNAVRRSPDSAEARFHLGVAHYMQDNPSEAARCFRRAVRLKPAYALAHYNLGHCLKKQGDRAGAVAAFRLALRYKPDYAPARKELDRLVAPGTKTD